MPKVRNEALHAELDRIVDLKLQMRGCKSIADDHGVAVGTVRQIISAKMKERRKRTNVMIHVEPDGERMPP